MQGYIIPIAAVVVCLITRVLCFGRYIDEWDSVNFAFGLSKGYDPLHDQPHFPGYPVYMFVSWIWYKISGSDIQALIFSGVLFSSFAVFPLYELARRLFSKEVAILTAMLYIVNPQVWLQAEKPLSDAFGLFFVIASVLFFYRATEYANGEAKSPFGKNDDGKNKSTASVLCLACGGILLGLGLGVRVTYLALIPTMAYAAFQVNKIISGKKVALWGLLGLIIGVMAWAGYLLVRFTPYKCYKKLLSHAEYHFCKEGNSILTTTDYSERFFDIFHNLSAHSLGTWWIDTPLLRIIPTIIIMAALVCFFIREKWNFKNRFLLSFFIPYALWIAFIQDAIRQIMVLAPFLLIIISAGVMHGFDHYLKDKKQWYLAFLAMVPVCIVTLGIDSLRIVSTNRNEEPPSVSTINYITRNYDKDNTKFYCLNDWRLFQYYAPEWCDKKNSHVYFVSRMTSVVKDLARLKSKPENILISSKLFERDKYRDRLKKLAVFKRNRYAVADYNWLALYSFK